MQRDCPPANVREYMPFDSLSLALDYLDRHLYTRFLFPIQAGRKFPPKVRDNLESNCSNDPEQIIRWAKKWPGCNWGVAHRKSGLLVVDVDCNKAKGKVGQATYDGLALAYDWPATERTTTPSGGFHLIYEGWADKTHPAHIMALGENGLGRDIDSPNYTLIPGCVFDDGTSYVGNGAKTAKCPEWIYDVILTSKQRVRNKLNIGDASEIVVELDQPRNIELAIDFLLEDAEPAIQGRKGDECTYRTAAYLKDIGISVQVGAELLNEYYNPRCQPAWEMDDLVKKMESAYAYGSVSKVGGKTAEADFADEKVTQEDIDAIPSGDPIKIAQQAAERTAARKREAEKVPAPDIAKTRAKIIDQWVSISGMDRWINRVDPKDNFDRDIWNDKKFDREFNKYICPKRGSAADTLLRMKKGGPASYYRVGFKPGQPQVIDDGTTFNMYRTPTVTPVEGDTSWWNEHLEYLFPDAEYRNHLLNWMAWIVQNLDKKPKHALIIQGEVNGTGKSFIGKVLTKILHQANVSIVPQNALSGRFNAWALQCKLIVVEELRAADRNAVKEALHDIITEDLISIEQKGIDPIKIENCFGILAFTNDVAALQLDNTDRRYLVIRTDRTEAEARAKSQSGYFIRLFAKLDDPDAMNAVCYSLMNRDLAGYSGQQAAPATEAKADMFKAGASDLEHWMDDNAAEWPLNGRIIAIEDVVTALPRRIENRTPRLNSTILMFLKRKFKAFELGQCVVPTGKRHRLYAINGKAGIVANLTKREIGKLYEEDKKKAGAGQPIDDDDNDAASDFSEPVDT